MRNTTLLFLGLTFLTLVISCDMWDEASQTERYSKTYSADGVKKLKVTNTSGDVDIRKWDQDEIEIRAIKRAFFEDDLDKVHVDCDKGTTIRVRTKYDNDWVNAQVDYEIKVPRNVTVEITNTSGDVEVYGVTYVYEVEVTSGDIKVNNTDYIRKVETTSGDIDVEINNMNRNVYIESTSGDIDVSIRKDIYDDINIKTTSGDVDYNGTDRHGSGEFDINIKATSGDVELEEM